MKKIFPVTVGVVIISIAAILISMNTYSYTDMSHHDDSYFNPVNVGATKERLAYVQAMCAGEIELIPQTIFHNDTHKFSSNNCEWKIYEERDIQPDDEFEKTWGGPGNRHPAFWGFDIPKICTEDMIKHLVKHSSMFDKNAPYAIEDIGFEFGIDVSNFEICVEELLERNTKEIDNENNIPDQLRGVFGNCACQERIRENPDTMERCPQPHISWENTTHYIDNIICEWREK